MLINDANTILASVRCRPASNRTKSSVLLEILSTEYHNEVVDICDNMHSKTLNDSCKQNNGLFLLRLVVDDDGVARAARRCELLVDEVASALLVVDAARSSL